MNTFLNLKFTNGRITDLREKIKMKEFDEFKSASANNIQKITVDTTIANINFTVSNSSNIKAHLYGQAEIDGNINLDFCIVNHELKITSKYIGNYRSSYLNLDVAVPQKTFNSIHATSTSATITLIESVDTGFLELKTFSGDLKIIGTFPKTIISTKKGNVNLCLNARKNIYVKITTISGNVFAKLNNIRKIQLSATSKIGNIRNSHDKFISSGYKAKVNISTMNGKIVLE